MNPLTALPPKFRRYAYAVLGLAALVVSAWQAADGDWWVFATLLLGSLGFSTAAANVDTSPPVYDEPDDEGDEDDELPLDSLY
jgi:hypothetical protein